MSLEHIGLFMGQLCCFKTMQLRRLTKYYGLYNDREYLSKSVSSRPDSRVLLQRHDSAYPSDYKSSFEYVRLLPANRDRTGHTVICREVPRENNLGVDSNS